MTTIRSFLSEIERFLAASGMTATAFGKAALKDPNFVFDLRGGRIPNLTIVERAQTFMRDQAAAQQKPELNLTGEAA